MKGFRSPYGESEAASGASLRMVWILALACLAAGALLTFGSLRLIDGASGRLTGVSDDMASLLGLKSRLDRGLAAREHFDRLPAGKPAPLAQLIRECFDGNAPEEVNRRGDLATGWALLEKDLVFGDAPIGKAIEFGCKAEESGGAEGLGWKVSRYVIKATPGRAGYGRVVLTLAALEKTEPRR